MASLPQGDITRVADVLRHGLAHAYNCEEIARVVVQTLMETGRLYPEDVTDVHVFRNYRWKHRYTGEIQEALHARHTPDDWVQEERREIRGRGEWKQIS